MGDESSDKYYEEIAVWSFPFIEASLIKNK